MRVVVPITAGSAIDIVARATAQHLAEEFGQPFVVENRPGAGTTIGIAAVASAPPDGYTHPVRLDRADHDADHCRQHSTTT